MKFLAISGSARRQSTNTALLRAVRSVAPDGIGVEVFSDLGGLPVFSPDLEEEPLPRAVQKLKDRIAASDALIICSPEYVRSIPGGLKNAIDWLVSGDELVGKPVALMHASHRGDDVLEALRIVLATVTQRFAAHIFARFPVVKMTPDEIAGFLRAPENRAEAEAFLHALAAFCQSGAESAPAALSPR